MSNLTTCFKCNGRGTLPEFKHIDDGACFRCNGTGKIEAPKAIKAKATTGEWLHMCSGEAEGVAMSVWAGSTLIKINMTAIDNTDIMCSVYADRAAWRRRDLRIVERSFGYNDTDFGDALDALRARLAAA